MLGVVDGFGSTGDERAFAHAGVQDAFADKFAEGFLDRYQADPVQRSQLPVRAQALVHLQRPICDLCFDVARNLLIQRDLAAMVDAHALGVRAEAKKNAVMLA